MLVADIDTFFWIPLNHTLWTERIVEPKKNQQKKNYEQRVQVKYKCNVDALRCLTKSNIHFNQPASFAADLDVDSFPMSENLQIEESFFPSRFVFSTSISLNLN